MHYGGVACNMDALQATAQRHQLAIIEDNAHGLFGTFKGRPLGTFGAMATQSFHETKNVTSGEGGALLLNDPALVARAEIIREKGTNRSSFSRGQVDKYTWVDHGSNYLSSELQAACLAAQLRAREAIQASRAAIWHRYEAALQDWSTANHVRLPVVPSECDHPSHLFYLLLPDESSRTRLIEHLKAHGILAVFHYVPLHLSPMGRKFGGNPGDCPVAEDIAGRLLRLPLFTDLSSDDQSTVIDTVRCFKV
jgi:dTDP-4-amino-4,6-dideoxygalactose transaminase